MYRPIIAVLFIFIGCSSSQENVVKEHDYFYVGDWSCTSEKEPRTVIFVFNGLSVHPKVEPGLKAAYEEASSVSTDYFLDLVTKTDEQLKYAMRLNKAFQTVSQEIEFTYRAPNCSFDFWVVDLDGREWQIIVPYAHRTTRVSCHRPVGASDYDRFAYCTNVKE
ncbi:MAG: hypothetical protein AAB575_06110 [Patescibacteria group bacterium]